MSVGDILEGRVSVWCFFVLFASFFLSFFLSFLFLAFCFSLSLSLSLSHSPFSLVSSLLPSEIVYFGNGIPFLKLHPRNLQSAPNLTRLLKGVKRKKRKKKKKKEEKKKSCVRANRVHLNFEHSLDVHAIRSLQVLENLVFPLRCQIAPVLSSVPLLKLSCTPIR